MTTEIESAWFEYASTLPEMHDSQYVEERRNFEANYRASKSAKTEMEAARDAAREQFRSKTINEIISAHAIGVGDVQPIPWNFARRYILDAFDAGYDARGSQWLAVSERLPTDDDETYYVQRADGEISRHVGIFDGSGYNPIVAWQVCYWPEPYTADSGQEGE